MAKPLVRLNDIIKTSGGSATSALSALHAAVRDYGREGLGGKWYSTRVYGGIDPEIWAWYDRETAGKTPEQATLDIQKKDFAEGDALRAGIASGSLAPDGHSWDEYNATQAKNKVAEAEYQQRVAAMAGNPPAPAATVNPANPEQRFNIINPTTGQKGYQSEGAPIPNGWQAIGGSISTPAANNNAMATLAGNSPTVAGATVRAGASDVSAPSAIFPTTALQPGARGDAVKQLQDYLVSVGLMTAAQVATGPGIYGPQTTAAVQALQQRLGVDNSSGPGYFGPKTIAALQGASQGQGATQGTPAGQEQSGSSSGSSAAGATVGSAPGGYLEGSNTNLRSLLSSVGIQMAPQTSLVDMVKEISALYGFDEINGEIKKLDDQYVKDVADVNDNPWLSETLRSDKIKKLEAKYQDKKKVYTDRLSLNNDIIGKAVTLFQAEKAQEQALLLKALDSALEETDAPNTTSDITEYNLAVSQGYKGSFLDYQRTNANLKATDSGGGSSVLGGTYSSGGGSTSSGGTTPLKGNDSQILEASRGADSYVDPNVYLTLYKKFISTGKTLKQFLSAYPAEQYVNPANTWLPSYLMPKKSGSGILDNISDIPSL